MSGRRPYPTEREDNHHDVLQILLILLSAPGPMAIGGIKSPGSLGTLFAWGGVRRRGGLPFAAGRLNVLVGGGEI